MSWRFARSLLVLLATISICGRAQSIFAMPMNVVNLRFVSDVRQEVVRDISISRYQLELLSLSEEERNICCLLALRCLVIYLCPVRPRDEIVAEN